MRKAFMTIFTFVLGLIVFSFGCSSCQNHTGSDKQLEEIADAFAYNYFNWHFSRALSYCTPESEPWLSYLASNVNQADIENLQNMPQDADIEIGDILYDENDSTAKVAIRVNNFLQMDSIDTPAHLVKQADYEIVMVLRNGKWLVRMEGLLQSENQSHD